MNRTSTILPREFFQKVRKLSQPKLKIYKGYIETFLNSIDEDTEAIIFDGFAGQGVYQNQDEQKDVVDVGSPLLALITGIDYLNLNDKCKFKFIFVEKDTHNYKILTKNVFQCIYTLLNDSFSVISIKSKHKVEIEIIEKLNIFFRVEIHNGEFKNHINRFETLASNQRLLTIADPFGYIDLAIDGINKLVGENKDLLVTFMSSAINRHKGIDTHKSSVCSTLRMKKSELHELNDDDVSSALKFGDYLNGFNTNQIDPIYFKIKNSSNATIYVLIFITSHLTAYSEMCDRFNENKSFLNKSGEFEYSLYVFNTAIKQKEDDENSCQESDRPICTRALRSKQKRRVTRSMQLRGCVYQDFRKKYSKKWFKNRKKKPVEPIYEVETILDKKSEDGETFYLIKWKNYDESHNTWEPEDHLSCDKILQKFKDDSNRLEFYNDIFDDEKETVDLSTKKVANKLILEKQVEKVIVVGITDPNKNDFKYCIKLVDCDDPVWVSREEAHSKYATEVIKFYQEKNYFCD